MEGKIQNCFCSSPSFFFCVHSCKRGEWGGWWILTYMDKQRPNWGVESALLCGWHALFRSIFTRPRRVFEPCVERLSFWGPDPWLPKSQFNFPASQNWMPGVEQHCAGVGGWSMGRWCPTGSCRIRLGAVPGQSALRQNDGEKVWNESRKKGHVDEMSFMLARCCNVH